MTRIFVSHACVNDIAVTELSQWLKTVGWNDLFVDHLDIPGGVDWNQTLPKEIGKAGVFVLYVTQDWLASDECYPEYRASYYGGRPVIPLLVSKTLDELPEEESKRFKTLCSSVQGIPFDEVPPNDLTKEMLLGSLRLAAQKLKRAKRNRILKLVAAFTGLLLVTLLVMAVKFREGLDAYIDRAQITREFSPLPADRLSELLDVAETPLEEREFRECTSTESKGSEKFEEYCPGMIALPLGQFYMGTTNDQVDPTEYTNQPIPITIPAGLAVSVGEITRAQWNTCYLASRLSEDTGCQEIASLNGEPRHPIASVSWQDAQAYVSWLNVQVVGTSEGPYRLLSEAEWEYAARGSTELPRGRHTDFYWGDNLSDACSHANGVNARMPDRFDVQRVGALTCADNPMMVDNIGGFQPNKFGLHDVAGNVAEWVEDCWHDNHEGRPRDYSAWTNDAGRSCDRVIKGGSWFGVPDNLRPSARVKLEPDAFGFNIGFRVARDLNWHPEE